MSELEWTQYPTSAIPSHITGNFGDQYGGASHAHMGTDVGIPVGTPIYAPAPGKIVNFTNDGSFGIGVCIEHPDTGWYSLYAHLSSALCSIGEIVDAGLMIGLSGNTGFSTGPHLHWQVCDTPTFPAVVAHNRDPMQVPFAAPEESDMTPNEKQLLLYVASVVGGWTNGKPFDTVEEALPSFTTFEEQDQRVLMGMDILNTYMNSITDVLAMHMAGHQGGMQPARIKELMNRLDDAQISATTALANLQRTRYALPETEPEPPEPLEQTGGHD